MRSLVIGGKGFIGAAIARELEIQAHEVAVVDREDFDICDFGATLDFMRGLQFDQVYHMAGVLGTTELNEDIADSIRVNVIGAANVMAACLATKVDVMFYPSKPNPWLNMYTITKEASEKIGRLYNKDTNLRVVSLRYFNVFGPEQHTHPVRKLVPTLALCARYKLPAPIFGDGHSIVDMNDIDTVARVTVLATQMLTGEHVFDLGTGIGRRVIEVARDIYEIMGVPFVTKHTPMRNGEDERTVLVADTKGLTEDLALCGKSFSWADYEDEIQRACEYYFNLPEEVAVAALKHHGMLK